MKAKNLHGVQPKRISQMSDEGFADLKAVLEGAVAFERAERRDLPRNSNSRSASAEEKIT